MTHTWKRPTWASVHNVPDYSWIRTNCCGRLEEAINYIDCATIHIEHRPNGSRFVCTTCIENMHHNRDYGLSHVAFHLALGMPPAQAASWAKTHQDWTRHDVDYTKPVVPFKARHKDDPK